MRECSGKIQMRHLICSHEGEVFVNTHNQGLHVRCCLSLFVVNVVALGYCSEVKLMLLLTKVNRAVRCCGRDNGKKRTN